MNTLFKQEHLQHITPEQEASLSKSFLANVFSYMTAGLAITGIIAYLFGTDMTYLSYLLDLETGSHTILGYVVMFAPIGFILLMGTAFRKMSSVGLLLSFFAFSLIMGMSLSYIFLIYTSAAIYKTFFITAITFSVMAFVGKTTSTDLSKFGTYLYMALVGLIIAMVINYFVGSSSMDYIISGAGVLIFTGLTAYDVQKLKRIGAGVEYGSEEASKLAIWGALDLYLDFINLFLFLLRFLGNRD
jgi:FtsH-binding integral membrane protein